MKLPSLHFMFDLNSRPMLLWRSAASHSACETPKGSTRAGVARRKFHLHLVTSAVKLYSNAAAHPGQVG